LIRKRRLCLYRSPARRKRPRENSLEIEWLVKIDALTLTLTRRARLPGDSETFAQSRPRRSSGCRRNDKWNSPFFEHKGSFVLWRVQERCVFGFWKGALIFGAKHKGAMGNQLDYFDQSICPDAKTGRLRSEGCGTK